MADHPVLKSIEDAKGDAAAVAHFAGSIDNAQIDIKSESIHYADFAVDTLTNFDGVVLLLAPAGVTYGLALYLNCAAAAQLGDAISKAARSAAAKLQNGGTA